MKHREIHEAIAARFHISNRTKRTLPWTAGQRYNRYDLTKLYCDVGYTVGAEIGVRRGRYSEMLCQANPHLHLYCIDPWEPDYKYTPERQGELYTYALERLSKYNVTIIRKTSFEALEDIENQSLDFIFIDGNHHFDYVMLDIILWSAKVRSGGIISCHDFHHGEIGVVRAVEAYVQCHNIVPWYSTKEIESTAFWVKP